MAEKMLWDKDRLKSVKASKLRDIVIYPDRGSLFSDTRYTEVVGWFNNTDSFGFGRFDTKEDAEAFVENLHARIEGRDGLTFIMEKVAGSK